MKLDAIKRQGARTDLTSPQAAAKFRADDEVAKELGISVDTVRRYIRLTELSPQLQQMVDEKGIALTLAVELSHLKPEEQAAGPPPSLPGTPPKRERKPRIAEDILRLKDTTKECHCTPEIFLSAFEEYTSRIQREMDVFRIPFYEAVFPALLSEHMNDLQRQINEIHAAADKFYNDVKGMRENEHHRHRPAGLRPAVPASRAGAAAA